MMKVAIRRAKSKDVPQLARLIKEYDRYEYKLDPFIKPERNHLRAARNFLKKGIVFVAEAGTLVGFANGSVFKGGGWKIGSPQNAFMLPKYRGKGIGTKMLRMIIDWCKKRNAQYIISFVHGGNKKALKTWKNRGFKVSGYQIRMKVRR